MSRASLNDLRDWLSAHEGFLHPALIRDTRDGITGIFASTPIAADEVLVDIPRSLILGPHLARAYDVPANLTHERDVTIFIFLIEVAKGAESKFGPWIEKLPPLEEFEAYHPLFVGQQEWDEFESVLPRITHSLGNFKKRILEFHARTDERFSLKDVAWAMVLYLSRAFAGNGLVPVADLFNHDASRGRGLREDRFLAAGEALAADQQVFINYGAANDTLEMWLHFGFWDRTAEHVVNCAALRSSAIRLDQNFYFKLGYVSENLRRSGFVKPIHAVLLQEIPPPQERVTGLGREAQELVVERLRVIRSCQ